MNGNEILMFIKGHTSVDSYRKGFHRYNPNSLPPNTNVYALLNVVIYSLFLDTEW